MLPLLPHFWMCFCYQTNTCLENVYERLMLKDLQEKYNNTSNTNTRSIDNKKTSSVAIDDKFCAESLFTINFKAIFQHQSKMLQILAIFANFQRSAQTL